MYSRNRFAKPVHVAAVAAILLSLSACGGGPDADVDAETNRLLQTDREFARASVDYGMADAFRAYVHEDAIVFGRDAQPVRGRDNIYDHLASSRRNFKLEWEPQEGKSARLGDLGWTWGVYTVSWTDSLGIPQVSYGRYVNVWKKDRAGEWKVLLDIGSPSPPPSTSQTDKQKGQ